MPNIISVAPRRQSLAFSRPTLTVSHVLLGVMLAGCVLFAFLTWRESQRAADEQAITSMRARVSLRYADMKLIQESRQPGVDALRDRLQREIDWCETRIVELMRRRYGDSVPPGSDAFAIRADVLRAAR